MALSQQSERFRTLKRAAIERCFDHLNAAQREAVFRINGPVLILAGAGSGKTTVLINRIAYMLRFGDAYHGGNEPPRISTDDWRFLEAAASGSERDDERLGKIVASDPPYPYRILAITFTNKAAGELKERLAKILGEEAAKDIEASTFHSACLHILRAEASYTGYSSSFAIYDADDSQRVIKEVLKHFNMDEKQFPPRTVATAISGAKDKMITAGMLKDESQGQYRQEQIAKVYEEYQRRLRSYGAMDFDDLILETVRLFMEHSDVLEKYRRRFRYIMVDEYQDTNRAQYALVSLLAGGHGNLCVVGDDDQSIYRFRGATIENILDFERQFSGAMVVRLEQNYRSTQVILDAANSLIAHNTRRKGKTLFTRLEGGEPIMLMSAADEMAEAACVASSVAQDVSLGGRYSDHAVLYRMNAQSSAMEQVFINSGIPYRIVGGTRFFERKEIKDILAYLSVIQNPADSLRLRRIINEPKRGIGEATVATAMRVAETLGITLFEALKNASEYAPISKKAKPLTAFSDMMEEFMEAAGELSLVALLDKVLADSGYIDMLMAEGRQGITRFENIGELKNSIARFCEETENPTLGGFLEEAALYSAIDTYDADADAVVMMTMHSAKGLEFQSVYIIGMEDGIFPSNQAMYSPGEMEEERRLCYVGVTRAKQKLHLLRATSRMMYGQTMRNRASRFLREVPRELVNDLSNDLPRARVSENHDVPARTKKALADIRFSSGRPLAATALAYAAGDEVKHRVFGVGEILSAEPMGGDILLEIAFKKVGIKKVMAAFANLQKI